MGKGRRGRVGKGKASKGGARVRAGWGIVDGSGSKKKWANVGNPLHMSTFCTYSYTLFILIWAMAFRDAC